MDLPDAPGSDAFVGRDGELATLLDGVSTVSVRNRLVLVVGEAGIGKTRLLHEAARQLAPDRTVVHGRAWDEIECPPYWPWTSAVREITGRVAGTHLRDLVLDGSEELPERFELFDATAAALAEAAERRPLVVMLDDLHAADVPSLLLTRFIAQEMIERPVAIVAAHRPVDADRSPEHHRLLEALGQVGTTIALGGLAVDDVARLAGDPTRAPEIHDVTRGNPLFVHQVGRAALSLAGGRGVDGSSSPDALRAVIADRIALLPDGARRTLAAVAVLGGAPTATEVAELLGVGSATVETHLDAIAVDGLVRLVRPERTVMVHSLVAEGALVAFSDVEELHRRAARLLVDAPDRIGERAQHLLRSGLAQLDEAVDATLVAADDAIAATAHEEAVIHCERALAALDALEAERPGLDDEEAHQRRRLDVLFRLGRALRLADRPGAADDVFDQAAALAGRLGDHRLAALAALRGGIHHFTRHDRDPELAEKVEAALGGLPPGDDPLRARLLADLAARTTDHDRACRLAADAVAMARRVDDPVALGNALIAEQVTDLGPETLARRLSSAREVLALARRADDPFLAAQGRFLLFGALLERGDLRGYAAELRAHGVVDDVVVGRTIARFELWMALIRALLAGDVERAEGIAGQTLDLSVRVDDPWGYRVYGAQVATIRWLQDRWTELESVFEAQWRENPDEPVWPAVVACIRAQDGRSGEAREALAAVGPFDALPAGIHRLVTMALAGEAIALVGGDDEAAAAREHLLPFSDRFVPINLGASVWGPVARPLGLLAARLGRDDEALAHLSRSIDVCERLGARPWLVEARLLLAEQLVRTDRRDDARLPALVDAARSEATALGLEWLLGRVSALAVDAAPLDPPVAAADDRGRPRVDVLGTFEVTSEDGRVAHWTSRKGRELLKFLVARRGAPVHREVVMDLLWPDVEPDELRNRYSVVLNTVRRALDPDRKRSTGDLVVSDRETVRLRLDEVDVDVEEFFDRARTALAMHQDDVPGAVEALVAAAEIHAGPAFPEEPYAEWAQALRADVRMTHLRVVRAIADRAVAAGDHLAAADAFRQLVDADPLDPDVHRGLADALGRLGAAAAADAERARFSTAASRRDDPGARSA